MLIVIGGLPGTGKSTIGRALTARWPAAYLRIDVIEHALKSVYGECKEAGPAGYVIAYGLARSNLALGMPVVADCVNPLVVTRESWRHVAHSASSPLLEVEVVCTDRDEHRRRVRDREADIQGLDLPTWQAVMHHEYDTWTTERLIIDSARLSAEEAVTLILDASAHLAKGR